MARPIWKGFITFGLVNIPVLLYTAESRSDLHFHLLDKRDKSRIRFARINESNDKEVPWNEIVKGYEYKKGKMVVMEEKDFKIAAVESSQAIDIEEFVDRNSIPPIYYDRPYYLVPEVKKEKGYVLLRETLRSTGKAGLAKVVIRTKQYLAAIYPLESLLILNLIRFANELVPIKQFHFPEKSLSAYKISNKEIKIAEQLISAMSGKWNPQKYHNDYQESLLKIISKKQKGIPIKARKPEKLTSAKVIDFMPLLQKSISEKGRGRKTKTPAAKKRAGK